MKVFISWSGELSQKLAEVLREWLPGVIQAVKPYFTPSDIDKGARWSKEIAQELEDSKFGLIILTRENLEKPWIMFESGALSKQLNSSHVCPILFGLENTDLTGPLVQFQSSQFEKADIKKFIHTINGLCGEHKLEDPILNNSFDIWWPKLETDVQRILKTYAQEVNSTVQRSDREIIDEILELSRAIIKKPNEENILINQAYITFLVKHFISMHNLITERKTSETVMKEVEEIAKAINHIVDKGVVDLPARIKLRRNIENLSFAVEDNDIPF